MYLFIFFPIYSEEKYRLVNIWIFFSKAAVFLLLVTLDDTNFIYLEVVVFYVFFVSLSFWFIAPIIRSLYYTQILCYICLYCFHAKYIFFSNAMSNNLLNCQLICLRSFLNCKMLAVMLCFSCHWSSGQQCCWMQTHSLTLILNTMHTFGLSVWNLSKHCGLQDFFLKCFEICQGLIMDNIFEIFNNVIPCLSFKCKTLC